MGEAGGSGLPVGWLFIRALGKPDPGTKEVALIHWLEHFKDKWEVKATTTLSDKDFSEINAMSRVFPNAKHQLCFWHAIKAIRTRLAILRRQPGFYNAQRAHDEFHWIDTSFVPLGQLNDLTPSEVGSSQVYTVIIHILIIY